MATSMPKAVAGAESIKHNQFTVKLVNPFTEKHGPITGYTIIVSKSKAPKLDDIDLPGWKDRTDVYQV